MASKYHTVHDLPDKKNLSAVTVSVETSKVHLKKKGKNKTDQGLQMLRVIRVLFDVEKRLEAQKSEQTLGKKKAV
jgi:hypothetical protein